MTNAELFNKQREADLDKLSRTLNEVEKAWTRIYKMSSFTISDEAHNNILASLESTMTALRQARIMYCFEGFSQNASDLFRIAVKVGNFCPKELMFEIHRRAPKFATIHTVECALFTVRRRYQ